MARMSSLPRRFMCAACARSARDQPRRQFMVRSCKRALARQAISTRCSWTRAQSSRPGRGRTCADTIRRRWRATVDEDGHYCFAIAL